jgi:hypothetical protein
MKLRAEMKELAIRRTSALLEWETAARMANASPGESGEEHLTTGTAAGVRRVIDHVVLEADDLCGCV